MKKIFTALMLSSLIISHSFADITVLGNGSASTVPNLVMFDLMVESAAPNAVEATQANASQTDKVIKLLQKLIPEKNAVTTQSYSVYPNYEYNNKTNKSDFIGFKVSNQISVKSSNLEIGSILDEVTHAGITTINNLRFGFDKPEDIYQEALAQAINNATARATILAKNGSLDISGIETIESMDSVGGNERGPMPMMAMSMAKNVADVSTPIKPDDLRITATVRVVFKTEVAQAKTLQQTN